MIEVLAVSDALSTSAIVACGGIITAVIVGRMTTQSKREDYRRQDEVAKRAKDVADNAAREAAAVAQTAREAASLLLEAQAATIADTEKVAQAAAIKSTGGKSSDSDRGLKALVISYPNGARREIHLYGTPSEGQHILLRNTPVDSQPFRVAKVLWVEATNGQQPSVILVVVSSADGVLDRRSEDMNDLMNTLVEQESKS